MKRKKETLHFPVYHADWELLSSEWQDTVDHFLAEEARLEQSDEIPISLAEVLAELGIEPEEDTE